MTCFSIHKSSLLVLIVPLVILLAAFPALAQNKAEEKKEELTEAPIVLELFTASDCSACILADRILYDAMKDKKVIALSCHIEDMSSVAANNGETGEFKEANNGGMDPCTFRQWAFTSGGGGSDVTVTIPMFYFNGQESTHGNDLQYLNMLLKNYHYARVNKMLEAVMRWKDKDTITIHLPQAREQDMPINASVWLVRYKDMAVEKMDKGVNAGRVLRFSNIVQNITHIAKWHGATRAIDYDVSPPQGGKERGGYAVLVAPMLGSPYLAAGSLHDYPVAADVKEEAEKRARAKAAAEGKPQALPSNKTSATTTPAKQ